jgi:hypothetical protein
MKLQIIPAALALATCSAWAATTYTFTGDNYTQIQPFTTCSGPIACYSYTASMKATGWFTTASPLGANLAYTDLSGQVTAYSFNDGINTIASTDPNARIVSMLVETNGSAQFSSWYIVVELWQSGTSPHNYTDRMSQIFTVNTVSGMGSGGANNLTCTANDLVAAGDMCTMGDSTTWSSAAIATDGFWSYGAAGATAATTYTFTSDNFTQIEPYTDCIGPIPCSNYTTSMKVTGWLTTSSPLGANLRYPDDIRGRVTAYSFNDGIHTITSTDPNARIAFMQVGTDGSGQLTGWYVAVLLWQSGTSPHNETDRMSEIAMVNWNGLVGVVGGNNLACYSKDYLVTASDTCSVGDFLEEDISRSVARVITPGSWSTGASGPTAVPALSKSGLLALAVLMGWMGCALMRRRLA